MWGPLQQVRMKEWASGGPVPTSPAPSGGCEGGESEGRTGYQRLCTLSFKLLYSFQKGAGDSDPREGCVCVCLRVSLSAVCVVKGHS